jgi:3-deoxy-D-manno-octulosonic-acid transferase
MMETEIWPNLYHQVKARDIPLLIANARISDRSLGRYRRFSKLTTGALGCVSRIAAQSKQDAGRLVEIGAPPDRVVLTGNLKFDIEIPEQLEQKALTIRETWGPNRPVLVAGSTHPEEEQVILESFGALLRDMPDALLVLVPRHPDRFRRAAQAAKAAGLAVARRSTPEERPDGAQCYLIDRMGELMNFYAACDVAFVGGSLEPVGGHNMLEPAALGKPVIVGPHTANFADIMDQLLDAGAAVRVFDGAGLRQTVRELFANEKARLEMGHNGRERVKRNQGAVNRTLDIISELLTEAAG